MAPKPLPARQRADNFDGAKLISFLRGRDVDLQCEPARICLSVGPEAETFGGFAPFTALLQPDYLAETGVHSGGLVSGIMRSGDAGGSCEQSRLPSGRLHQESSG
jgi:hypothetical protein